MPWVVAADILGGHAQTFLFQIIAHEDHVVLTDVRQAREYAAAAEDFYFELAARTACA